jgi:hypothetical protein
MAETRKEKRILDALDNFAEAEIVCFDARVKRDEARTAFDEKNASADYLRYHEDKFDAAWEAKQAARKTVLEYCGIF